MSDPYESDTERSTVPPENYELWDGDREQYRCPFCDGRMLRVGTTAECTECGERFRYEGQTNDGRY